MLQLRLNVGHKQEGPKVRILMVGNRKQIWIAKQIIKERFSYVSVN